MIISSNYNNVYSFQKRKKAENKNKEDKSAIDKLKTIHNQNSEIVSDFASALIMSKINFISKLCQRPETPNKQPVDYLV